MPLRLASADNSGMSPFAAATASPRSFANGRQASGQEGGWSAGRRRVASLLIALHLTAVVLAPFAFASRTGVGSSSPLADGLMVWFRPYIDLMYLNHGYSFFAPNLGPSHLVRYRVEFDDGRPAIEGVIPNLQTQRPRLLYHRHFMLAETVYNVYAPPEEPPAMPLDPELAAVVSGAQERALQVAARQREREQHRIWKHSRNQYQALRHSMEQHLMAVHGGSRVTLTRIEHRQLPPGEFAVLGTLEAPHTYRNLPEGGDAPEVIRP